MKKISWKGILSAFLLVAGILQLTGGVLMLLSFKIAKPQNFILGIAFLVIAIALHKAPKAVGRAEDVRLDSSLPMKCPKCGRTYDSSWKVCLQCSVSLISNK